MILVGNLRLKLRKKRQKITEKEPLAVKKEFYLKLQSRFDLLADMEDESAENLPRSQSPARYLTREEAAEYLTSVEGGSSCCDQRRGRKVSYRFPRSLTAPPPPPLQYSLIYNIDISKLELK